MSSFKPSLLFSNECKNKYYFPVCQIINKFNSKNINKFLFAYNKKNSELDNVQIDIYIENVLLSGPIIHLQT